MHEELENFERNQVWELVDPPPRCKPIGTKWVWKNKEGEKGEVVRNKSRFVAHGFSQKERIDYEETFALVAHGFESEKYPHRVYKLRKALYGSKQAPRTWYGWLRGFLSERGFEIGKVDQTLFLLRQGRDNLIVQVYVDDIVFGGSSNSLVARFAKDMRREFEMSMMGELQFFVGLQMKQSKEGTFVHQAKYTKDIVWNFKMVDSKAMMTPMSTTTALHADEEGEHVDKKEYRSMTGSLLYLTATRPDI
jgi:CRISPR/Cas system Type II protein with McrA/HNH and RuvC-like nuclease domain